MKKMTVFDSKKRDHLESKAFLDGGVNVQRYDTVKYRQFDKFTDKLFKADCHEVKIIEDFTDLDANTVSDDIVESSQDTMTLLGKYIDDLDVNLDKTKLKTDISKLYHEAQDLEL